jgi:hypothetical protein
MYAELQLKSQNKRDYKGDLAVRGRIILKWILKKYGVYCSLRIVNERYDSIKCI